MEAVQQCSSEEPLGEIASGVAWSVRLWPFFGGKTDTTDGENIFISLWRSNNQSIRYS